MTPGAGARGDPAGSCPTKVIAVVAGRRPRGASVAAGLAAPGDGSMARDAAPDAGRPRPRRRAAARLAGARHRGRRGGRAARRGDPGRSRSPTPRRGRPVDDELGEIVDRAGLAAAQTPQGARAGLLRAPIARHPADGPERFTDEAALLRPVRIRVHRDPRRPREPQGHACPRSRARRSAVRGAPRGAHRAGSRLASLRAGRAAPARRHRDRRRAAALRPLRRRRRAPRDRRRAARRGRARATSAASSRPTRRTPRGISSRDCSPRSCARLGGGRLAPDVDRRHDHRRPAAARRPSRRDARCDRRAARAATSAVSVKASTGNLSGDAGAGRAISAAATVTIRRDRDPAVALGAPRGRDATP